MRSRNSPIKIVYPDEHVREVQVWDAVAFPVHAAPPFAGAGLSHRRVRDWVPPPHVLLQVPQVDHAPHFPLTEMLFGIKLKFKGIKL